MNALCPPGVRMTVLWAASVCSVTKGASVRMEPSVITSTGPVCVKLGLKALIARRGSVPRVCMASSVTSTAPVIAPTPWGEPDATHTPSTPLLEEWGVNFSSHPFYLSFYVPVGSVIHSDLSCDPCFIQNFSEEAFTVNVVEVVRFQRSDIKFIAGQRRQRTLNLAETSTWVELLLTVVTLLRSLHLTCLLMFPLFLFSPVP